VPESRTRVVAALSHASPVDHDSAASCGVVDADPATGAPRHLSVAEIVGEVGDAAAWASDLYGADPGRDPCGAAVAAMLRGDAGAAVAELAEAPAGPTPRWLASVCATAKTPTEFVASCDAETYTPLQ